MQVSSHDESKTNNLSHFRLSSGNEYLAWRQNKLEDYPRNSNDLLVLVKDMTNLSSDEKARMNACLAKTNMCIYQSQLPEAVNKEVVKLFAGQFGLTNLDTNICADEDSITSLQTKDSGLHVGYIPYSSKKLSWHTDGYYNKPENTIRGMLLHCVNNAPIGGENQYLDPEILFIHLRDINPDFIRVLMDENALTIPANEEDGVERAAQTGPVFSLDNRTGSLHLRYTARTRSIQWDDNELLREALDQITKFLASDSRFIFRHKLQPGQGIICNNVLHNRTAFEEDDSSDSKRLIYRARFYDRVLNT